MPTRITGSTVLRPLRPRASCATSPASPSAGPIFKNKLFAFGDYQAYREVLGVSAHYLTVPTTLMRTGNFTELLDSGKLRRERFRDPVSALLSGHGPRHGQPLCRRDQPWFDLRSHHLPHHC